VSGAIAGMRQAVPYWSCGRSTTATDSGRDYAPVHEQRCNLITEEGPGQIYAEHLEQGGGSPTYLHGHSADYT
jgi:hypothetical protein